MRKLVLLLALLFSLTLVAAAADPAPVAVPYALEKDVSYVTGVPRCTVDVYHPTEAKGFATLVWFHGGGLTAGQKYVPAGLKEQQVAVVAANYRLMPGVGIETCLEDAAAALAWTLRNIERFGGDPRKVFVGGHSAGAYLATLLVMDPRWMAKAGMPEARVAGLLAISGQMVTHFELRKQRGMPSTQIQVDEFAPLFHVKAGLPPVLLVTGDREMELLGRHEENAYFARMLRLVGNREVILHELQGYDHGGVVEPSVPLMLRQMKAWAPGAAGAR